ncbi:MAG: SGNH/GDSL hydrolase family protein [Luteolibacter sp.]
MFAWLMGMLGLSGCAVPPVPGETEKFESLANKDPLAVLFIGNSYSFGVPSAFKKHAESKGRHVRVGHSTYGGWTLEKHSKNPATLKKLREGDWDIVVIQDFSMNPSRDERERRKVMDAGVQFFVSEARAIGAVPILYQTWGRRDGDPERPGDDFYSMNQRVRMGYRNASLRAGGIPVVSAGDAWEREFRAGRGKDLFVEDGSHPSSFGNAVTAEVFYKAIFRD